MSNSTNTLGGGIHNTRATLRLTSTRTASVLGYALSYAGGSAVGAMPFGTNIPDAVLAMVFPHARQRRSAVVASISRRSIDSNPGQGCHEVLDFEILHPAVR